VSAASISAWELVVEGRSLDNPMRVEFPVLLDFPAIRNLLKKNTKRATGDEILEFNLPKFGPQECRLYKSNLFASKLQAKLPDVVLRTGICTSGIRMFLNLDASNPNSFSASFTVPGSSTDWFYVDHVDKGSYVIYAKSSKGRDPNKFDCGNTEAENTPDKEELPFASTHGRDLYEGPYLGATVRIAVVANNEYAARAGNTKSSVSNAIAAVMSRVNGIYMRELGLFFQLIDKNDLLLCVTGAKTDCNLLPNDDGSTVLGNSERFSTRRGVSASEYDIGHIFTT
jgi:hypothetical protein